MAAQPETSAILRAMSSEDPLGNAAPNAAPGPNAAELVRLNSAYATDFADAGLGVAPERSLAIVACMDSRMDVFALLGLNNGEAHVIRNAGGVITDDVVRSLCLSQVKMGTTEIILVHHTNCGLQSLDEDEFRSDLQAEFGAEPTWDLGEFVDPYEDVRLSMRKLTASPFVPHTSHMSGFVYDVESGLLNAV